MLGNFFLVVGTTFSVLASMIAFLVTYLEYRHRFEGRRLWKEVISVALFTLVMFLVISWALAYVLPGLV
jgi:hypothetical protein